MSKQVRTRIGVRIRTARQQRGMTIGCLALAIGVSRNTVGNWEAGTTDIGVADLVRLCNHLSVDPAEIMAGLGQTGPEVTYYPL